MGIHVEDGTQKEKKKNNSYHRNEKQVGLPNVPAGNHLHSSQSSVHGTKWIGTIKINNNNNNNNNNQNIMAFH